MVQPVSYTHLDVYKRQHYGRANKVANSIELTCMFSSVSRRNGSRAQNARGDQPSYSEHGGDQRDAFFRHGDTLFEVIMAPEGVLVAWLRSRLVEFARQDVYRGI